jgi:hypothetical protein
MRGNSISMSDYIKKRPSLNALTIKAIITSKERVIIRWSIDYIWALISQEAVQKR